MESNSAKKQGCLVKHKRLCLMLKSKELKEQFKPLQGEDAKKLMNTEIQMQ